MTIRISASDADASFLALLDAVAAGNEVEITRSGRVVARLVAAAGPHGLKGSLAGTAITAGEDEDLFATGLDFPATR